MNLPHNFADGVSICFILFGANVDVIIAERQELGFHPVYALQRIKVESIGIINIPETNVLPKLTGKKDTCKDKRAPIRESNFNLRCYDNLLQVD